MNLLRWCSWHLETHRSRSLREGAEQREQQMAGLALAIRGHRLSEDSTRHGQPPGPVRRVGDKRPFSGVLGASETTNAEGA